MALHIYTGGTTGAADGTLEVGGDEQGLTLAVGATGVLHLRCDEGGQTDEGVVVNAPTGCEVSADGVTFGATATYPAGSIQDVNVACHVKRTATGLTEDEWRGGTTTPRLALVAVEAAAGDTTAPVIAGTLIATVDSSSQVTLSGVTATDNVGIAKWQYQVDGDAWVDVTSTSGTFPATQVGGLSADTAYTFAVRALDAAGNASAEKTASATVPDWTVTYDFSGATLPTGITSVTTGAAVCAPNGVGQLEVSNPTANTDIAHAWLAEPINLTAGLSYKERVSTPTVEALSRLFVVADISAIPAGGDPNETAVISTLLAKNAPESGDYGLMPIYYNTAGTLMRWHSSGTHAGTWSSTQDNLATYKPTTLNASYLWFILETTSTQWRMVLSPNEDGSSPVIQTAWVNISNLMDRGGTGHYLCLAAQSLPPNNGTTLIDTFKVV